MKENNMEDKTLITYKWNQGVYSLQDLLILVKYKNITPKQFFEITRFSYDSIIKEYENK